MTTDHTREALAGILREHTPRRTRLTLPERIPGTGVSHTVHVVAACTGCEWFGDDHLVHLTDLIAALVEGRDAENTRQADRHLKMTRHDERLLKAAMRERDEARAEIADEYGPLLSRQAATLTATVNALRGTPPPLTHWSHHDVADVAAVVVRERDEARAALAVEWERIGAAIERLRRTNPINGDGSNNMLDKVIDKLDHLAGDDRPSTAAAWERARRADEDDKRTCEMYGHALPPVTHVERLAARIARSSTDGGGSDE